MARNQRANCEGSLLDQKWTKMFKRLQGYQQEHDGSCNVPYKYHKDPKLGRWVDNQRQTWKKGLLAKERCHCLESIGFEWTVRAGNKSANREKSVQQAQIHSFQDQWTKMFKRLQAFKQEHDGSCNVPNKYHKDPKLGRWVDNQRQTWKKGLLAKERCDQLEAIGFKWKINLGTPLQDQQWTKMFERLQVYQGEQDKYLPDPPLGRWIAKQRHRYKKGVLTKERCDQLEAIGFEWTGNRELARNQKDKWNKMFKRLQGYQQKHDGSCNVPQRYPPDPKLANWVMNQRSNYKRGLLTKERYDRLQEIGFQWTLNRAGTSTRLRPISKASKTKRPGTQESLRWRWV